MVQVLVPEQLLGNLSRVALGWKDIRRQPPFLFSLGAVPAFVVGSRILIALLPGMVQRLMGVFLLGDVALRHTPLVSRPIPKKLLAPVGVVVGFLSPIAGSAGPLATVVLLNLQFLAYAYVSTEAVTAILMHLTKSIIYGRYAAMAPAELGDGLVLGVAMKLGSWTGGGS